MDKSVENSPKIHPPDLIQDNRTMLEKMNNAAFAGNVKEIMRLRQNGCPWTDWICRSAAKEGKLMCLAWLHENGCPWNADTCTYAASSGHLACLKYAHEQGCPWTSETCEAACRTGQAACFIYARENGCPWSKELCMKILSQPCDEKYIKGREEIRKWIIEHPDLTPVKSTANPPIRTNGVDNVMVLNDDKRVVHDDGTFSTYVYKDAYGVRPCYERESDRLSEKKDRDTFGRLERAAEFGDLKEIIRLHQEEGIPWSCVVTSEAAKGGHLKCLIWLHENGCPWNTETCSHAASEGHLACLKYAHENGCGWNVDTCSFASWGGRLTCFVYARENGCPWNKEIVMENLLRSSKKYREGRAAILRWIREHPD